LSQKNLNPNADLGNVPTTAQDILILLLPNLPQTNCETLFEISLSADVLTCKDNGVQKRGYKILAKLVESGRVAFDTEDILKKLDKMVEGVNPAAKKVWASYYHKLK
jgi:ribosomal RNA-processing protein 12